MPQVTDQAIFWHPTGREAAADVDLESWIGSVRSTRSTTPWEGTAVNAELNDGAPDGDRVNQKRVARVMRAA